MKLTFLLLLIAAFVRPASAGQVYCAVDIEGVAAGGQVTLSFQQGQGATVNTAPGDSAATVASKLAAAFNLVWNGGVSAEGDKIKVYGLIMAGDLVMRSTDAGIKIPESVNSVTASVDKESLKVTLSWKLPAIRPSRIVIFRDGPSTTAGTVDGDSESFTDTNFSRTSKYMADKIRYRIVALFGERYERPSDVVEISADNPIK